MKLINEYMALQCLQPGKKQKAKWNKNYRSRILLRKQIEIDKQKGIIK
jgi:hypothetical protein